jgi:glycosyltransferase involved in cell wall biosynthesis
MSKIVIDARESGTTTGRYIDKLIEYLYKLKPDHEITILTKPHRVEPIKKLAPGFKVFETTFKEFSFSEQSGFNKQLTDIGADLVHFGMVQQPVTYKGRVVTTIHDLTTLRFVNPSKNLVVFKVKQKIYSLVMKKAARKSRIIMVPTMYVKKDLLAYAGISSYKVTVTYESADSIKEKPEQILDLVGKQFIMYVGRPMPHKNLDRLIEAFSLLQSEHPDLILALAGKKDSNYEMIESRVNDKNIKNIIFTDFISDGQLRWMYENCSAYIFPSLSEGFGLPGLEAMRHGAPVVSSNATCLPEVYGNAAHYFDPLDNSSISGAINDVLTSPSLKQKLVNEGKSQVEKYSWKRMAKQTLAVYEEALK